MTDSVAPRRSLPFKKTVSLHSSLEGLQRLINADDKNKKDYSVQRSRLEFTDRRTLAVPTSDGTREYGFSPDSFDRFANLLGVPTKFLSEQPVTGIGSQQDIVNQRLSMDAEKSALIRVREAPTDDGLAGTIRSVHAGDWVPFDNRHLLAAVSRALREHDLTMEVASTNVHEPMSLDRGLVIRLLSPEHFDLVGDEHKFGVHAYTSEVLDDHVDIAALLWRQVCTNGLMGWGQSHTLHQRHKTVRTHEIMAQVVEATFAAFRHSDATRELVEGLASQVVDDPIKYITERAARGMKLSDGFVEVVSEAYQPDPDGRNNRYTVMQAFTAAARSLPILERPKMEAKIGAFFLGKLQTPRADYSTHDRRDQKTCPYPVNRSALSRLRPRPPDRKSRSSPLRPSPCRPRSPRNSGRVRSSHRSSRPDVCAKRYGGRSSPPASTTHCTATCSRGCSSGSIIRPTETHRAGTR